MTVPIWIQWDGKKILLSANGNFTMYVIITFILYSNKKDTSDFHGTVSFGPINMYQVTDL